MREIKFRAWDGSQMRYKFLLHNTNGRLAGLDMGGATISLEWKHGWEIMQYAGLKDKNGKEIYEGDIFNQGDKKIKYLVEWVDTGFKGKQLGTNTSWVGLEFHQRFIEVIGNIYENPEL